MPRRRWCGAVAALLLICASCGGDSGPLVPLTEVRSGAFAVTIDAFGELEAARSTPIEIPPTLRGVQRIAWLAADGALVENGELVARLDSDQIDRRLNELRNRLRKLEFQLEAKKQELDKELRGIEGELRLLAQELDDARATAPRDERLFSRQAIVDAEINIELIETKIAHFKAQLERTRERQRTELEIVRLQRETEQTRISQQEDSRRQLEILAPHAGFFLVGSTWQKEKMRIGMELWSGQSLGELPDLDEMEAKVYVLESEAAGLAEGLEADITLDAHPGSGVRGTVKTIQPIANPIEEQSPVKYFEVVLSLARTDPALMRPTSQVRAEIFVTNEDATVSVPNQAIFVEGGQPWVYVLSGGRFEKRSVELGQRSVSRTVILAGLDDGERIALVDPDGPADEPT